LKEKNSRSMRTCAILFSARVGNGVDIAKHLMLEDDIYLLSKYQLKPCSNCHYECFTKLPCPITDDLKLIFELLNHYDQWVIITPTYDNRPPSLFYIFEERLPSLWNRSYSGFEDCYKNKKVYLIIIGNDGVSQTERIIHTHFEERNANIFGSLIIKPSDYSIGGGIKGSLIQNKELLEVLKPIKEWVNHAEGGF